MATLAVDEVPRFGAGLGGLTAITPDIGGDEFPNTGREMVAVLGVTGWTTETVQAEGVPSGDAGRDGTATLNPGSVGGIDIAGPFKPRNWNTAAGALQLTYPGGITGLELYLFRFTTG